MDANLEAIASIGECDLYTPESIEKFKPNTDGRVAFAIKTREYKLFSKGNFEPWAIGPTDSKGNLRDDVILADLYVENADTPQLGFQNIIFWTLNDFWRSRVDKRINRLDGGLEIWNYSAQEHADFLATKLQESPNFRYSWVYPEGNENFDSDRLEGGHEIGNRTGGVDLGTQSIEAGANNRAHVFGLPEKLLKPIDWHFNVWAIGRNYREVIRDPVRLYQEGDVSGAVKLFTERLKESEGAMAEISGPMNEQKAKRFLKYSSNVLLDEMRFNQAMTGIVKYVKDRLD
jgi:hypothetical protein